MDIRDKTSLKPEIEDIDPEVIIHLDAQPLVRDSYRIPVETFDDNVMGPLNFLEASKNLKSLNSVLIVSTDKVYKSCNHLVGDIETDELGGDDPYSASNAASDIAIQSWIKNFATSPTAVVPTGNVIGGAETEIKIEPFQI